MADTSSTLRNKYPKGITKTHPFYMAWTNMKTRCYNTEISDYSRYGGRGITVCDEWRISFLAFYDDMLKDYEVGLTLDRIDNDKGYSKGNCRWASRKEQALNTRNIDRAERYTFRGKTKTIREWAEEYGIKRRTLSARLLAYGWTIDKALDRKVG